MAIYGYVRVSSVGQARDGNGLEVQREAVQAAGASEIVEDVFTGLSADRPGLKGLLTRVQDGDTVVVAKLDRLARSVADGCAIIKDLIDRGVAVRICNMGIIDDTPTGKLTMHILLAFAEYERDLIRERLAAGRDVARQRPDYQEGRPRKYSEERLKHAVKLLESHSYNDVVKLTGISKSTLIRAVSAARTDNKT